eukprot:Lankesteria_metandrocarpae@DN9799_c0_g1_i1.p1
MTKLVAVLFVWCCKGCPVCKEKRCSHQFAGSSSDPQNMTRSVQNTNHKSDVRVWLKGNDGNFIESSIQEFHRRYPLHDNKNENGSDEDLTEFLLQTPNNSNSVNVGVVQMTSHGNN